MLKAVSFPVFSKLMVYLSELEPVPEAIQPGGSTKIKLGSTPALTVSIMICVLLVVSASPATGLIVI